MKLIVLASRISFAKDWIRHHNLNPKSVVIVSEGDRLRGILSHSLFVRLHNWHTMRDAMRAVEYLQFKQAVDVTQLFDNWGIEE